MVLDDSGWNRANNPWATCIDLEAKLLCIRKRYSREIKYVWTDGYEIPSLYRQGRIDIDLEQTIRQRIDLKARLGNQQVRPNFNWIGA